MTHLAKNEDWFEAQGEIVLTGDLMGKKSGKEEITPSLEQATIVVDALLLYGCVYCQGKHTEKAEVFHRIVAPEFSDIISIADKDLKTAFLFMISLATVIEQMVREYISNPEMKINYKIYQDKIKKYKPTLDAMLDEFEESIFGIHFNRRNRDTFIETLGCNGWKYFEIKDLNELFSIMYAKHGTV